MKRTNFLTAIVTLSLLITACSKKQETKDNKTDFVEITNEQFVSEGMQLSAMESKTFETIVKCTGIILPKPNGMARVTAPIAGVVRKVYCVNGAFVKKNDVLLELTGNEVVDVQRDYAEAAARYKRLMSEYVRLKSLFDENVISEKDFVAAQSDFKSAGAAYSTLKLKLQAAGISVSAVENEELFSSYTLKAPINGYVAGLRATIGTFINQQSDGIEIADPSQFHLLLSVFASDVAGVKKGQKVRFENTGSENLVEAVTTSVGVSINPDTKSIDCYANIIADKSTSLIANNTVNAEIITQAKKMDAVPSEAVIKSESNQFVLILHHKNDSGYSFTKVLVEVGRQQDGYTELKNAIPSGKILTKGTHNIVF